MTHAEWNGCTWVDLIFPFFIFMVGVTSVYSLDKRVKTGESLGRLYRHILIRAGLLFFIGLVACSYFICGWLFQSICPPGETQKSIWAIFLSPPTDSDIYYFSLTNLRIMGVLQRIALVYLAVSLLLVHTRWRVQAIVAGALLLLYWALMSLPGFSLEPGQDLGAFIDRAIFGEAHLWRYAQTWDPEGLLSTLPAIATGLFGALTGHWLRSQRDRRDTLIGLFLFGFFGIVVGSAWGYVFPTQQVSLDEFLCGLHRRLRPHVSGRLVLVDRRRAGEGGLGYAIHLARHEPAFGLLRGPDRLFSPWRSVYRHADPAHPHY